MDAIIALYQTIPTGYQVGIAAVLGLLVVLTHVLPHVNQERFGQFGRFTVPLSRLLQSVLNFLAGNYRNTKNR